MRHLLKPLDESDTHEQHAHAEVETARLCLRMFVADDADELSLITRDPEVMRYIATGLPISREETTHNLNSIINGFNRRGFGRWAVTLKETGRLIGYCGLTLLDEAVGVELVYLFGKDYWGKGIATEAARASLHYAFKELKLKRVVALTKPDNARSRRVLERIGMKFQTYSHYYGYDCVCYEMNRTEFCPDIALYLPRCARLGAKARLKL
jgi:ribosomal-protein-alanine N-acetyltransferase